jgi:ATP-dependent helicase HepA
MSTKLTKGQRWISEAEPELGLGIITGCDSRYVDISFPSRKTDRRYSLASAPLRRIKFKPGDTIQDLGSANRLITTVAEDAATGLVIYACGAESIPEERIADTVNVTSPLERFFHGIVDTAEDFDLRASLLRSKAALLQSPVRGYCGCRIELLPHQLSIAETVASRGEIRALLADETGLGKTIEACLIIHRLLALERISRVLIVVPDHLVNQWFVELLRRFNLTFRLFTKEYCGGFDGDVNPFCGDQLGIIGLDFLMSDASLIAFVIEAPWDLLIVDEAHHLRQNSPPYSLVKRMSAKVGGLLLLTATPEQLGKENHFARLHLLDPLRYARYEDYEREAATFREV